MRSTIILGSTLLLALTAAPLGAQTGLPPSATAPLPTSRFVVSYEVSAALLSNRLPSQYARAIPEPLLDELAADEAFSGIDLGGSAGNGVLVRFDFPDMESYREWEARGETQQLLAELRQAIGYGYSRSSLSMRRVPADAHHTMPTAPRRRAPAPGATQPNTTKQAASRTD
jgi:hypothetical protein